MYLKNHQISVIFKKNNNIQMSQTYVRSPTSQVNLEWATLIYSIHIVHFQLPFPQQGDKIQHTKLKKLQVVDTAHIILYKVEDIKYKQTWITPSAL